jgi:hypothetical protein
MNDWGDLADLGDWKPWTRDLTRLESETVQYGNVKTFKNQKDVGSEDSESSRLDTSSFGIYGFPESKVLYSPHCSRLAASLKNRHTCKKLEVAAYGRPF